MMTKKRFFLLVLMISVIFGAQLRAQVSIGTEDGPHPFSILELNSKTRGFRLPQLTTKQREDLEATFGAKATTEAMGLLIFNTTTKCVEIWNGTAWIQQGSGSSNPPGTAEPVAPMPPATCGIEPNADRDVWTAILDPNAEKYEFFIYDGYSTISQGKQTSNVLTLSSAVQPYQVTVKYYYPLSFLKPAMVSIPGNNREWEHGVDGTYTSAAIPGFKMSETPVTQAQFEYVMGFNESPHNCIRSSSNGYLPASALPMDGVSWNTAIAYCNKLSLLEGKTPVYSVEGINDWAALTESYQIPNYQLDNWCAVTCNFAANGYRLPTASEWEYAARAHGINNGGHYVFSGSYYGRTDFEQMSEEEFDVAMDSLSLVAWFYDQRNNNSSNEEYYNDMPKPVKNKRANFFGLYDMSGNVNEWCWDIAGVGVPYPAATPTGIERSVDPDNVYRRIARGGHYAESDPLYHTVFAPYHSDIDITQYPNSVQHSGNHGFRVVCSGR